ncbi:phage holin family protein [Candidatus Woesebacteria bacterium]|nr:phage holin family protein [Candidatus Woesebacteria bacterium]
MLRPIIRTAIILFLLAWFLPTVSFYNWITLVVASLVVTILFSLIKPILKILLLPINIITLGMFSSVLNTLLLYLAIFIVPGFSIEPMIVLGIPLNQFFSIMLISILMGFLQPLVKLFI